MKVNFRLTHEKLIQIDLFLIIAILPAIVYMVLFQNFFDTYDWCGNIAVESDLFLIAKGRVFLIICILTSFLFLWFYFSTTHRKGLKVVYKRFDERILLSGYVALCIFSYLFSCNRQVSLHGAMEQHETILILLGYSLICGSFIHFSKRYNLTRTLGIAVLLGCGIQIIVCLFQYSGKDMLGFPFVQKILIPNSIRQGADSIELFTGTNEYNKVYGTLYNPNYLGLYTNLMLPLVLTVIITVKRPVDRIVASITAVMLVFVTFASGSKAFVLAGVVQLFFTALLLRKTIIKYGKYFAAGICLFLVCFILYNAANDNILSRALINVFHIQRQEYMLESIAVTEESVRINYNSKTIHLNFSFDDGHLEFWGYDENGVDYATQQNDSEYLRIKDDALSSLTISAGKLRDRYVCVVTIDGIPWYFTRSEEGYHYITPGGKESDIFVADSVLTGYERALSGRGYIWSRSIPLLKDALLLGSGPDTYMLQFPQNDYVAAVNTGYYNTMISRPHSAYLQMGIQTGVLSMLLYITLFCVYALKTLKTLTSMTEWNSEKCWKLGILVSLTGYMIATLSSDSLIVTASIFWTLLGIGIGLNHKKSTGC